MIQKKLRKARKPNVKGATQKNVSTSLDEILPPKQKDAHGYFRTFDATKLFYSTSGSGSPVLFLYGLICSKLHWKHQIRHLKNSHQTIWMDYRGHHNSDVPNDLSSLSIESLSKDVLALLDELQLGKVTLVAHSLGVNVALDFAHRHPDRVEAMVLANGAASRPLEAYIEPIAKTIQTVYNMAPKTSRQLWKLQKIVPLLTEMITLAGFNKNLVKRSDVRAFLMEAADLNFDVVMRLLDDYRKQDATAWLHTVTAPTLVIAGRKDFIIPLKQQEILAQLMPNARLEIIEHGSHCPQMDLPELLNFKIEKFIENN